MHAIEILFKVYKVILTKYYVYTLLNTERQSSNLFSVFDVCKLRFSLFN